MITGLFGGARRARDAADRRALEAETILSVLCATLRAAVFVIRGEDDILAMRDGIGLLADRGTADPPESIEALIQTLGDTRDIRASLDIVMSRRRGAADPGGERPIFAVADSDIAGEVRWIGADMRVLDGTGDPDLALLVLTDQTAEQERESRQERRVALMRRALDRAPFGLVVLNEQGLVRETNTAFRRLIGARPIAGKPFEDLFHPGDRGALSTLFSEVRAGAREQTPTVAVDVRLADDADRVLSLYANRTQLAEAGHHGILVHALDATERKRLETQFAQSQKMQAVGQLAGGIAHDFNNVLTAIIGYCDLLLQRHQPGDPSFADVMQIQQNANRAAGLTRQLLAFSRQQTIRSRVFDVTDTLAEISTLLRRLLGEAVELSMVHGRDLWPIRGDRGQLEQVIINLAVNARDAMPKGGHLIVQTDNFTSDRPYHMRESVMPAGEYVVISVTDTGVGIPSDALERLFEPFYTTKEVGQGTGLGLAMVYGSITQMGGYVVAHSDGVGKGASFSLYLPRVTESEAVSDTVRETGETLPTDDTGAERVLLVEDEDAVRMFAARALRSKGYTVTEARTGEVALEILSDTSFDLLVTDMVMPKVDGPTLIREARKTMPDLPVICISGYTRETVAQEVAELPRVSFLSKPFSLKQLTTRVRAALESDVGRV